MPAGVPHGSAVSIGNFDGVHVGHRSLLLRCAELARARGGVSVAVTFEPPPSAVLRPGSDPPRLCTPEAKRACLVRHVDRVEVLTPSRELLAQTPQQFVEWLVREHRPFAVVEGPDFHFGKGRSGTLDVLRELGRRHGFEVVVEPRKEVELSDQLLAPVNSSLVRWLIGRGRVRDAALCQGEPFALSGAVIRGEQQGRRLGVPTVNLDPASYEGLMVPMDGVYAGTVMLEDGGVHAAAISVGTKPTFGTSQLTVEAHLLDFRPEPFDALYGGHITVAFSRWVREQWVFPDVDSLRAQLERDVAEVRRLQAGGLLMAAGGCGVAAK